MTENLKIQQAMCKMVLIYPWFASIGFNLKRIETEKIATMAVDGTNLFYKKSFVDSLSEKHLIGVLCHEILHCVLLHPYRIGGRNPVAWNYACDAVVNSILLADNIELPPDHIKGCALNLTAEDIYDDINSNLELAMKDLIYDDSLSKECGLNEGKLSVGDWEMAVKTNSLTPNFIKRMIDECLKPIVNWKEELSIFLSEKIKSPDKTWSKKSRRFEGLQGRKKEELFNIGICIDTSGSVDNKQLTEFMSEVNMLCSLYNITRTLVTADADIHQIIKPTDKIPNEFIGGGGTDFRPAVSFFEKNPVDGIIYFTDGFGEQPSESALDILWVLNNKEAKMNIGKSIYL